MRLKKYTYLKGDFLFIMNILTTGATGFIGKNLVRSLVNNNHKVKCLIRETSKKADIDYLKKIKVQLFYGDITKKETLNDCLSNIDVVYHLAGILGDFNTQKEDYYKTHVLGTKNLLKFCKKQKFIYCSSAGVLGPVINGDELKRLNPTNVYEKTKAEAEKLVLEYDNYVILRPEFVYGAYDLHVLNLFKTIKNRKFYIIGNGKNMLHPTYVDDLIYCLIKCLNKNIKNEIFVVAGEKPVSVEEFVKLAANQLSIRYNKIKIPLHLARVYTSVFEPFAKVFNLNPSLTKSRFNFFTKTRTFDIKKAQKMLNYRPIKLEKGIKKTLGWYKKNNLL